MAILYQTDYTVWQPARTKPIVPLVSIVVRESVESALTHLECPECGQRFNADQPQTICTDCQSPLLARYDLEKAKQTLTPGVVSSRSRGIWRWAELLPVRETAYRLTLGEGDTPFIDVPHLSSALHLPALWIKDESANPTGTFKARGLAVAVARARELGLRDFVIPTAGNAGGALAAYAARASANAHVFMPKDAPVANQAEVRAFGAQLVLVDGLISDAGQSAAEESKKHGWFNISTFKEPYRLEGKKTMGMELAEHFKYDLPDAIIYPTGGGTGLVGMWKAFEELEGLGWLDAKRPRMITVQAAGCAPVVRTFEHNAERAEIWKGAATIAAGLCVPVPFADRLILRVLRASNGTAVAVTDEKITAAQKELAESEGVFAAPEGAASLAALKVLLAQGWIKNEERVVLFNTGSGLKYL
jgi:threonine synthase